MKACSPSLLGPGRLTGPDRGWELSEGSPTPTSTWGHSWSVSSMLRGRPGAQCQLSSHLPHVRPASGLGLAPHFQPQNEPRTELWGPAFLPGATACPGASVSSSPHFVVECIP